MSTNTTLQEAIYKKISYTNQDYNSILEDLVAMFNDSPAISSAWNNVSEADIMFILMSLLAAHKDTLNYMVDYRTLEGYMSTAREWSSKIRIANSFGYKVPSFKAARSLFQFYSVTGLPGGAGVGTSPYTLQRCVRFVDANGSPWAYIGEEDATLTTTGDYHVELYQGTLLQVSMVFDSNNAPITHIITNQAVAIGNNYDGKGCSKLIATLNGGETIFTEIESIYGYYGTDLNVYELNVDPQGITYIKFLQNLDMAAYRNHTFVLYYIATNGALTTAASNVTTNIVSSDNVTCQGTFTPVAYEFYAGSNSATSDEIREGFKHYYASVDSLVTLDDYANYILNVQKVVPGIDRCLVVDGQSRSDGGAGQPTQFPGTAIGVYFTLYGEAPLAGPIALLEADIAQHKVTGVWPYYNTSSVGAVALNDATIVVKLTSGTIGDSLKVLVSEYVSAKNIGSLITDTEIIDLIHGSAYASYFPYGIAGVSFRKNGVATDLTEVQLSYNEYPVCTASDIVTAFPA